LFPYAAVIAVVVVVAGLPQTTANSPPPPPLPAGFIYVVLKELSHEIDFKNFDKNLQNLT
jgi:hypothetical protein